MSVHWFFPWVSLAALLDPSIPSSLPSPATWWRTCAYVGSDLSLLFPLVSRTPCPACSYFPILPRPWCPRILLTSSDLNSSACLVFLILCFLSCPFCAGFSSALANVVFFLFFALYSFPFLSAASQIPCSALALPAGWASLVGCAGGAGCVLLSCWWFSTMLKSL